VRVEGLVMGRHPKPVTLTEVSSSIQRNGDICLLPDGTPPPSGIAGAHKVAILDATDESSWRWQPE
jgi:hypothetical protein